MEADDYNPHLREEAIARHNEAVKASVATIIELGHAKERIATLEAERLELGTKILELSGALDRERVARKDAEARAFELEDSGRAIGFDQHKMKGKIKITEGLPPNWFLMIDAEEAKAKVESFYGRKINVDTRVAELELILENVAKAIKATLGP